MWRPPTPTIYVSVPLCSIISVQVTIQSFNLTGWELVKKTILESFFFFFLFSFTVTMKSHPNQITANIHLPAHSTHCDQLTFCMTSSLMPASSMGCCAASGPASAAYAWKQAQSQLYTDTHSLRHILVHIYDTEKCAEFQTQARPLHPPPKKNPPNNTHT